MKNRDNKKWYGYILISIILMQFGKSFVGFAGFRSLIITVHQWITGPIFDSTKQPSWYLSSIGLVNDLNAIFVGLGAILFFVSVVCIFINDWKKAPK